MTGFAQRSLVLQRAKRSRIGFWRRPVSLKHPRRKSAPGSPLVGPDAYWRLRALAAECKILGNKERGDGLDKVVSGFEESNNLRYGDDWKGKYFSPYKKEAKALEALYLKTLLPSKWDKSNRKYRDLPFPNFGAVAADKKEQPGAAAPEHREAHVVIPGGGNPQNGGQPAPQPQPAAGAQ